MFIMYFEIDFVKGYIRYNYVNFFVVFRFNVFFEDFDFFEQIYVFFYIFFFKFIENFIFYDFF